MLNLMKLESRIVLDGAAVAEGMDHASDHDHALNTAHDSHISDHADSRLQPGNEADNAIADTVALLSGDTDDTGKTESVDDTADHLADNTTDDIEDTASASSVDIVLISDSLSNYEQLADAASADAQVIIYDADTESAEDIIEKITRVSQETGKAVNSISILSHGESGSFELGTDVISAETINENSAMWAALNDVLTQDSHIYIFGCNVSDGSGDDLLDTLADVTGADVFASDDATGASGDWDLEVSSENADDAAPPLDTEALADYAGTLADNTVTTDEDVTYTFEASDFGSGYTEIKITALERGGDLKLNGQDVTLNQEISLSDINSGNLTFTPEDDANGDNYSNFTFKTYDGSDYSESYTMTVNVTPVQDAPTSVNSVVSTREDTAYTFSEEDFLFNDVDTDVPYELAEIQITALATNGTLTLNGNAVKKDDIIAAEDIDNLVFTPDADETGSPYATFRFKVSDGEDYSANDYAMTINVTSDNDAPTASDNTITIVEDNTYSFEAEDFGFEDASDGDSLVSIQITQLESAGTLELNGEDVTVNQEISAADIDNLVFTPEDDANGDGYATFRFKVYDGTDYSTDAYTITIDVTPENDAPTADDAAVSIKENTSYTFEAEDFNFEDVDDDELASIQITQLETAGTLTLDGEDVTRNDEISVADIKDLVFTPDEGESGNGYATFQFKVNDGTVFSDAVYTMTINVSSVNDLPTAADSTVTTEEDSEYEFGVDDFNFEDADNDSLVNVKLIGLPTSGTLTLNGTAISQPGTEISVDDIEAGNLIFIPDENGNGEGYDSFSFKVSDGTGYSESSYNMTIDVTPVNDLPTSDDKTVTTDEEGYVFETSDFSFDDVDGDTLEAVKITKLETAGTLTLDGDDVSLNEVISVADIEAGRLVFTPDEGADGDAYADFQFKVYDGTDYSTSAYTVTINVTKDNIPPTSPGNTVEVTEDTTYTFTVDDFNFDDADGDSLSEIKITQLETAGTLQLNGQDVRLNQVISVGDIEDGGLTFLPNKDADDGAGYATFSFKVNDGTDYSEDDATMTLDVIPVQDAPTSVDSSVQLNEDSTYSFTVEDFIFNDVDTIDQQLVYVQITSTDLPDGAVLQLNGNDISVNDEISYEDIIDGELTFTPAADEYGDDYASFEFKVGDGKDYSVSDYTMSIKVIAVPDGPVGPANPPSTDEDTEYTFTINDFEFEDVDFAEDFLKIQVTKTISSGTLRLDGEEVALYTDIMVSDIIAGKLTFEPNEDANEGNSGVAFDFQFRVYDTQEQKWSTTPYMMTINVTPVNDPPTSEDGEVYMEGSSVYTFKTSDFEFEDRDDPGYGDESVAKDSIIITELPDNGTLMLDGKEVTLDETIQVKYDPDADTTTAVDAAVILMSDIEAGKLTFVKDQGGNRNEDGSYADFEFLVYDGIDHTDAYSDSAIAVIEEDEDGDYADYTMTIYANNPPDVNLNPDDTGAVGPGPGSEPGDPGDPDIPPPAAPNFGNIFTEGDNPVNIADSDAVVTDPDGDSIISMIVTITPETMKSGDILAVDTTGTNITSSYNAATGVLTLTGDDTTGNYSSVLQNITFTCGKDNENPDDTSQRRITVEVTDSYDNTSEVVTSYITVVPVNDAPVNYMNGIDMNDLPSDLETQITPENTSLVFSDANGNRISIADIDAYHYDSDGNIINDNVLVTLTVDHSELTVTDTASIVVAGNGTDTVMISGTVTDINAALALGVTYTPEANWIGEATLTITTDDQGATGDGGPLSDTDSITIMVGNAHPHPPEEPSPPTQEIDLTGIVRPDLGEQEWLELGEIPLPGPVQPTGDVLFSRYMANYPGCKEEPLYECCTLEEALRIGCRLAPAINPEAKLCNVSWEELGWESPFVPRINDEEDFNDELDLFTRLFMKGPEGETFNDMGPNRELARAFGMDEEQAFAKLNRDEEHDVYSQLSMQNDTMNDSGPAELKQDFFTGREAADVPPGRWRDDGGNPDDC